jgi:hypothetical protein
MNPDDRLNQLFHAARRDPGPDCSAFGFETRLLARMREIRKPAIGFLAWKLAPIFAAVAVLAGTWYLTVPDPNPLLPLVAFQQDHTALTLLLEDGYE